MKRFCILLCAMILLSCLTGAANALTIIDNSSLGFYNASIGEVLNGTNPIIDDNGINTFLFPNNNSNPNDPVIDPVSAAPDLSAASSILGNWLNDPTNLNTNWNGPQAIPSTWTTNSETAIIYEFDAGVSLQNTVANFGVDNGIFVWLDGNYLLGQLRPGGAILGELTINIGNISTGTHFLQVLREDHGSATGYSVLVTGAPETGAPVPEPTTLLLLGSGLACLAGFGRKKIFKK